MSWRDKKKSSTQRGYGYKWQQARKVFLQSNPLCCMCKKDGRIEPATVADHIKPHQGDLKLFWDRKNWQAICARHHNSDKQALERSGKIKRKIGLDGYPVE